MATLIELDERGLIHKLDAGLSWRQQENRLFYAFPKAQKWMLEALPLEISQHDLEIAPLEQLDAFLCLYCAGDELEFERQFRGGRVCLHRDWRRISGSSAGCFLDLPIWAVMQGGRSPTGVTAHIGGQVHAATFKGRLSKYA